MAKSKKRLYISLAVLFVLAVTVFARYIYSKMNAPSYGTVNVSDISTGDSENINLKPIAVVSKYASFNYPAAMKVESVGSLTYPVVDAFSYYRHDIQTWSLAIQILKTSSSSLTSNSAYLYRKQHPQIFSESHESLNGQSVDIMTDTTAGGFSKLAIFANSQYQVTVALSGDDPQGATTLQPVFDMVLSSWKWQ